MAAQPETERIAQQCVQAATCEDARALTQALGIENPESMKTFGYAKQKVGSRGLLEMREVTFTGSAASIREIGRFLLAAAEEMEKNGAQFNHLHIAGRSITWLEKWPDIVVSRSGK